MQWHVLKSQMRRWLMWVTLLAMPAAACAGDTAAFDLIGPDINVTVNRQGHTLPIAEVPNLQVGDRLWIHPILPNDQRARYLLIVTFLRGATNPPPDSWFTRAEMWTPAARKSGVTVSVPKEAEQALIFLAPQTGGDFATLRSAVQGKPGAFVRAAQDLQIASLHRARLEKYLTAIRDSADQDSKTLHERATMLARSLSIKLDEDCFNKPVLQQASCLMQNSDQLVLDDGAGQSVVSALTDNGGGDLLGALSETKAAGSGAYSPYVGAVVDLAKLMENLHTAKYQYISALALPQGNELHLRLNTPPSFHKPQSVLVVGLPSVQAAMVPKPRPVPAEAVACLQNPKLVLGAEGAPLMFSSELAHDLMLRIEDKKSGHALEIPISANALLGGFVPSGTLPKLDDLPLSFHGQLHGLWGFEPFEGPTYQLQRSGSAKLTLPESEQHLLIAGHDYEMKLAMENSACVEQVNFRNAHGKTQKIDWKSGAGELQMKLPLEKAPAGDSAVLVRHYGAPAAELRVAVYEEACQLTGFEVHAGDNTGILKGGCLDRVAGVEIGGGHWQPSGVAANKQLDIVAQGNASALHEKQTLNAKITLKDGRVLETPVTVLAPRPRLLLVSKLVQRSESPIRLEGDENLPVDGQLRFRVRSEQPANFAAGEKIEVASTDGFYHAELSLANGDLIRQNEKTVMATLHIDKSYGASVFGALRFRAVNVDGMTGDWQPLVTLVRLPGVDELHCPEEKDASCQLSGSNLFLLEAVASDASFKHSVAVSENEMAPTIEVPRPHGKRLYVKLRDNPATAYALDLAAQKNASAKNALPPLSSPPATVSPATSVPTTMAPLPVATSPVVKKEETATPSKTEDQSDDATKAGSPKRTGSEAGPTVQP